MRGDRRTVGLILAGLSFYLLSFINIHLQAVWIVAFWLLIILMMNNAMKSMLVVCFVVSAIPFCISANWLDSMLTGNVLIYQLSSASPFYQLLRFFEDPWVSRLMYEDSPFHYQLEAPSANLNHQLLVIFLLIGVIVAARTFLKKGRG